MINERRMPVLFPFVLLLIDSEDDRLFLEGVYEEYHRLMYAQALRVLRDGGMAQDAVSDSLMALMKKIDLLRTLECNKLRAYIVITVKHTALSMLRRQKRERIDGSVEMEDLAGVGRVEDRLMEQAGVERVKNLIRALPEREKDLMLMKYFREMTDEEIAEETGLRPVSVRVHLSRARKHLAAALEGGDEAP